MQTKRSRSRSSKRSKRVRWAGWAKKSPSRKQRTTMMRKCGRKCFLGPKNTKSFPICSKNTCKVNSKGVYAAYVRSKQWGKSKKSYRNKSGARPRYSRGVYSRIAKTAKKMLKRMGVKMGKK